MNAETWTFFGPLIAVVWFFAGVGLYHIFHGWRG